MGERLFEIWKKQNINLFCRRIQDSRSHQAPAFHQDQDPRPRQGPRHQTTLPETWLTCSFNNCLSVKQTYDLRLSKPQFPPNYIRRSTILFQPIRTCYSYHLAYGETASGAPTPKNPAVFRSCRKSPTTFNFIHVDTRTLDNCQPFIGRGGIRRSIIEGATWRNSASPCLGARSFRRRSQ